MNKKGINWLYGIVLGALSLPMGQSAFRLFSERPLNGFKEDIHPPTFSLKHWFNGEFQDSTNIYASQTLGFRGHFVRFNNQIAYTFFKESKANNVTIGYDNYLLDISHIRAYTGADCTPENVALLQKRLEKLAFLQNRWKEKGIQCVLTIQSGKGYFFPESIPDRPKEGKNTLYKVICSQSELRGINLLDLSAWARTKGRNYGIPLYNRSGIHWTYGGATLAADTLLRYLKTTFQEDIPQLRMGKMAWSETPRFPEETDVFDGMNIFQRAPKERLAYPEYTFTHAPRKLKLLSIGDSYYFTWLNTGIISKVFDDPHFAFYFNEFFTEKDGIRQCSTIDLLREIESRDLILLSSCDANLEKLGWGFIEKAYELYTNEDTTNDAIQYFEKAIRADSAWMELISTKARSKGITVDEMIREDALFLWKTERIR